MRNIQLSTMALAIVTALSAGLAHAAEPAAEPSEQKRQEAQATGYDKFGNRVPTAQTYEVYPTLSCNTVERMSRGHITTILGGNDQGPTSASYWGDTTPECK